MALATDASLPTDTETAEMGDRPLRSGEIDLCLPIFKNAIDYTRVKVHNKQFWWFFGFQKKNTVVSPIGEIFYPHNMFQEDFSLSAGDEQCLFIHEMVHVWQYQLGYGLKTRAIQTWNPLSYEYTLDPANSLCDYNMEAQGNLICDYFALTVLGMPELVHEPNHVDDLALYAQVLGSFLANPADNACLPRPHL